jgi:dipeptidyl aminopeptidase/acylaminoacyl peptidase
MVTLLAPVGRAASNLELGDLSKIVEVFDPQLSPDGQSVVFVVARPKAGGRSYDQALVLVNVSTGSERVLTFGRTGVSSPRWSPSGDRIAFLDSAVPEPAGTVENAPSASSNRVAPAERSPKDQIFVMPMSGGDPYRITSVSRDVEQIAWSPDGSLIAYVTADDRPGSADAGEQSTAFEVADNGFLETEAPLSSHLWIVPAAGGTPRRLTSGTWSLPHGVAPSWPGSPLSWSPDGKSIAIVQQPTPNWGDYEQSTIAVLDVDTGRLRKLTRHTAFEAFPTYSPDGSSIAYWYPRDGDPNNENEIFTTNDSGGDGVDATRALDRDIVRAVWSHDGNSLLLAAHDGARVALWLQPRNGNARKLDIGEVSPDWEFWVDVSLAKDGAVAFAGYTANRPGEIYYLPPSGALRRLTAYNEEIASRAHARCEEFRWEGPNGFHEDGVIVYPPGFTSAQRYPLVLLIHGGPQAASTLSFNPLAQLLAQRGYLVFLPNYRGSDNNGNAYQRAVFQDAGAGPGEDIMAGLHALERKGFVDSNRIAVSGWSYGGYMTAWLIGHFHIWKAAVAGAAITDLIEQYALSDNGVAERYSLGGPPWSEKLLRLYREQSPITYVNRMTTPTLILSNTGDARVPITQSYLLFHALKDKGVPVQFAAFPARGHAPSDPNRRADAYRRWIDWIDRYMAIR